MDSARVVLVSPQESMNVGAIARVVKNFGVANLRLVSPRNFDRNRANITACHAQDILDRMEIYSSLESAVSDCVAVVGFSGKDEGVTPPRSGLDSWVTGAMADGIIPSLKPVALVFGPEDTGLTREHTPCCQALIRIPTSSDYPSLNLSHAVAIVLYVIFERVAKNNGGPTDLHLDSDSGGRNHIRAVAGDYEQLSHLVTAVATASGFYREGTPEPVPRIVANILRRLDLSEREMAIFMGLFGRVNRTLARLQQE